MYTTDEEFLLGTGPIVSRWDRPRGFAVDAMAPQRRNLYNLDPIWDVGAYANRTSAPDDFRVAMVGQPQPDQGQAVITTATSQSTEQPGQSWVIPIAIIAGIILLTR